MLSNKTNLLEEADRLAVQSALSSSTIDSSDNSLLQDQVDSIEETIIYLNTSMVSRNLNVINVCKRSQYNKLALSAPPVEVISPFSDSYFRH